MKSIQTKFILLMITGILISMLIIGGVGISNFRSVVKEDSTKIMNLTCSEKAQELNTVLERIEQSVKIMAEYALDNLESTQILADNQVYMEEYIQNVDELGNTIAHETDGAVAVYVRLNPKLTLSQDGFFKVRNAKTGVFENHELTDLSKYSEDEVERVGWYYLPVQEKEPVWLQPYYNKNIDVYMISYVIPIYKDEELVGVVGMDIDFNFILEKVHNIQIYETGHAFLTNENYEIVCSKHYKEGTSIKEFREEMVLQPLENGMYLAVTIPSAEINKEPNMLVGKYIGMAVFIVVIFIFVTITITKNIVRPLKELDAAAKEVAAGNLDVSLFCDAKDEVGTLASSLKETVKQLRIRIEYINNLAYTDKLTGIKNNTSYLGAVSLLKEEIKEKECEFFISVIDINGLKNVNDTFGHDYGNELIITAAKVITEVFGYENLYRTGGDEFVVIIRNANGEKCSELEKEFERIVRKDHGRVKLFAAIGSAIYDKETDDGYENVFKRADAQMYQRKQVMKEKEENSTIIL